MRISPEDRFVQVATALGTKREGMTGCGPLIIALDEALRALPEARIGRIAGMRVAARAVIDARLAGCESAFYVARWELQTAVCQFWQGVVLQGVR